MLLWNAIIVVVREKNDMISPIVKEVCHGEWQSRFRSGAAVFKLVCCTCVAAEVWVHVCLVWSHDMVLKSLDWKYLQVMFQHVTNDFILACQHWKIYNRQLSEQPWWIMLFICVKTLWYVDIKIKWCFPYINARLFFKLNPSLKELNLNISQSLMPFILNLYATKVQISQPDCHFKDICITELNIICVMYS